MTGRETPSSTDSLAQEALEEFGEALAGVALASAAQETQTEMLEKIARYKWAAVAFVEEQVNPLYLGLNNAITQAELDGKARTYVDDGDRRVGFLPRTVTICRTPLGSELVLAPDIVSETDAIGFPKSTSYGINLLVKHDETQKLIGSTATKFKFPRLGEIDYGSVTTNLSPPPPSNPTTMDWRSLVPSLIKEDQGIQVRVVGGSEHPSVHTFDTSSGLFKNAGVPSTAPMVTIEQLVAQTRPNQGVLTGMVRTQRTLWGFFLEKCVGETHLEEPDTIPVIDALRNLAGKNAHTLGEVAL